MRHITPLPVVLAAAFATAALSAEGPNPYTGRQEREQVFQFARRPTVAKQGERYLIRFASKAACDATVAIVDEDGNVVRHLASGVLGENAPWPFEQALLEQALAWDGRSDDGEPVDTSQCRVKVDLGLKAKLAGVLGWSPAKATERKAFAVGPRGDVYVLDGGHATCCQPSPNIRVFDRECRYLRRILPPMSSVPPEKSTFLEWNRTTWGSHVPKRTSGHYAVTLSPYASGASMQTPVLTGDGRFLWNTCK